MTFRIVRCDWPVLRPCTTVRPTRVVNRPTPHVGQFATHVLSCAPANHIGRRFAWPDAIGQCAVSVPHACAGVHRLTHSRTHRHTYVSWELCDWENWLCSALRALAFHASVSFIGHRLASAKVFGRCSVVAILYRQHVLQINLLFAPINYNFRHVYCRERLPIVPTISLAL